MKSEFTFIHETVGTGKHAGSKARKDVDAIFYTILSSPIFSYKERVFHSIIEKIRYVFNIRNIKNIFSLLRIYNKKIFIQYPFYCNPILREGLLRCLSRNNVILIIHDVNSLRDFGQEKISDEIKVFNKCKGLIVHNKYMLDSLQRLGVISPMIKLDLFDYIRDNNFHPNRNFAPIVSFAGNLSKSTFLYNDLENIEVTFFLYGINYNKKNIKSANTNYKGAFSAEEIPARLEGSFGLIWDGDSIDTCSGAFGEYTRYNNPHKLSLYVSSCLPVIVWSQAAIADFVKEQDIGFCVDKLTDINAVLDSMTEEDYARYLKNITALQEKVISGYFTKKAIRKAMDLM